MKEQIKTAKARGVPPAPKIAARASVTPGTRAKAGAKNDTRKARAAKRKSVQTPEATVRETSKLAKVVSLLRGKEGATIEQLMKATGWQSHSVRGAISGAIKKKLGLTITSTKVGDVRTYRIAN